MVALQVLIVVVADAVRLSARAVAGVWERAARALAGVRGRVEQVRAAAAQSNVCLAARAFAEALIDLLL